MHKNEVIRKYEKDVAKHFAQSPYPVTIPYFNTIYAQMLAKGTTQAAPPMWERMEITFADWQSYVKEKEYNNDFADLLK